MEFDPIIIVSFIKGYVVEFWALVPHLSKVVSSAPSLFGWDSPSSNSIKINTDGAARGNPSLAGFGGVFRDSRGVWITGFFQKIGFSNSLMAELLAIKTGLQLVVDQKIQDIVMESNSLVAITLIRHDNISLNSKFIPIFLDCRRLLNQIPRCRFQHTFREANIVADGISKIALDSDHQLHILATPTPCIQGLVVADSYGICYFRPP